SQGAGTQDIVDFRLDVKQGVAVRLPARRAVKHTLAPPLDQEVGVKELEGVVQALVVAINSQESCHPSKGPTHTMPAIGLGLFLMTTGAFLIAYILNLWANVLIGGVVGQARIVRLRLRRNSTPARYGPPG